MQGVDKALISPYNAPMCSVSALYVIEFRQTSDKLFFGLFFFLSWWQTSHFPLSIHNLKNPAKLQGQE